MNLRRLLPRFVRGEARHHRAIFRMGVAYLMSGTVELTSLGKMTTDWRTTAVSMAEDKWELRRFFEIISQSKPYPVGPQLQSRRKRAESMAQALAAVATGTVEALSAGYVSADWYMLWVVCGEEWIDKVLERLKVPE